MSNYISGLTRRGFVAAGAAAVAVSGAAGLALADQAPAEAQTTVSCDICIVGAGISGLAAAVQAGENGNSVVVVEKLPFVGGNGMGTEGIFAVGSHYQQEQGIDIDPVDIVRTELTESQWRPGASFWIDLVEASAGNIDWLESHGVEFSGVVDNYWTGLFQTMHWFGEAAGAGCYVPQMEAAAREYGVEFYLGYPATQLIQDENGAVCGVIAQGEEGTLRVDARAVIVGTGGIGANPALLAEAGWDQGKIDEMMYSASPAVNGDGHDLGVAVGGRSTVANAAIQAFQGVHAFGNDYTAPYNSPLNGGNGIVGSTGIPVWVDQDARRFTDESLTVVYNMAANASACLGNKASYAIFDQAFVDGLGMDEADRAVFDDAVENGDGTSAFRAGTVAELAEHFGLDADVLVATIERYNGFCDEGRDGEVGKDPAFLVKVGNAPFYICKIVNNLVIVHGSIATNIKCEALDDNLDPIPGLYMVGLDGAMNWRNVYTQNMPGSAMGNNVFTGRKAANNAAAYIASL